MCSDRNKTTDAAEFPPSQPILCTNGCGFFGTVATMGLCSKCYRDLRIKEDREAVLSKSSIADLSLRSPTDRRVKIDSPAVTPPTTTEIGSNLPEAPAMNRCLACNKKVGVIGLKCRCGGAYCMKHRYPEKHDCTFDYKSEGRNAIANANPVIKADKIQRL